MKRKNTSPINVHKTNTRITDWNIFSIITVLTTKHDIETIQSNKTSQGITKEYKQL